MAENKHQEFKELLAKAEEDFEKFYDKGIAAAGTRVRKSCQDIAAFAKHVRKDVMDIKIARKTPKV
jgi:vacuolar-type H+-ATPase subunit H